MIKEHEGSFGSSYGGLYLFQEQWALSNEGSNHICIFKRYLFFDILLGLVVALATESFRPRVGHLVILYWKKQRIQMKWQPVSFCRVASSVIRVGEEFKDSVPCQELIIAFGWRKVKSI